MSIQQFRRSRFTISAYILLGFYAFMQTSLGAIVPFIRDDLSLNYTQTGLHITMFALGMVVAGVTGAKLVETLGRRTIFWGSGLGMCLGGVGLSVASVLPLTIAGTFLMGWSGTYLLVLIQSTLADEHDTNSAIALTESNIVASVLAAIAPVVVGFGATLDMTWRLVIIVGCLLWTLVFVFNRRVSVPINHANLSNTRNDKQLPRLFWYYWIVIFLCVAMEWCVIFWSADFLDTEIGLPPEQAATVLSVFLVAMIVGRLVGSRLTHLYTPQNLLWVAILLIAIGFPMFLTGQVQFINVFGLFVVGLGVANLFPLSLSIASRVGHHTSDLASSRISLAAGLAILIIPQVLGSAADLIGIFNAFMIVPIFLGLLVITLVIANRQS